MRYNQDSQREEGKNHLTAPSLPPSLAPAFKHTSPIVAPAALILLPLHAFLLGNTIIS